ncbi:hypothetical protein C8Q70DRAFT_1105556 [Cubamyces menziesii]|uniref:Fungal-type protein kinase domain-containing protein n=1 Tax=Trametes cubensis TaxID=1111947 RepID=A0AAD7XDB2_9APHY|nr:hypothetical protein C8Q70DRAFT_1105556 [Cubamyces menziesii]KAJ8496389.1 hypothetical protein ONZ51_g1131 [Trametes cubensis]
MAHKAVRVDMSEFSDMFFPLPTGVSGGDHPVWSENVFDELTEGHVLVEKDIQERFLRALDSNGLVPNHKVSASSEKPDVDDMGEFKQKVDAAIFKTNLVPGDGRPHWGDQLVPIEFKRHETNQDPFEDSDDLKVDANAKTRKEVRGQIISYAEIIFRVQHRVALFMLLVIGRNFRFLRWDRSGTIVTRAIDYVANPHILCEALWRMSLQSDEQLGVDPSATRLFPEDDDYKLMDILAGDSKHDLKDEERKLSPSELRTNPPTFAYVRELFLKSLDPKWTRYRVEVPDGDTTRTFLIGGPTFYARGMAGRGTKGFVAWDCKAGRFVWLKDAWRLDYERMDREGDILKQLNDCKVANVPTLCCHGDIRKQKTKTPDVWEAQHPILPPTSISPLPVIHESSSTNADATSSSTLIAHPSSPATSRKRSCPENDDNPSENREECPLRSHAHYRIVVEEVCRPLGDFTSGQQLITIVLSCLHAHKDAYVKAKIIHRDVSSGNILILPQVVHVKKTDRYHVVWRGILADWELSKPVGTTEPFMRPRQPLRTGTWQFLSVGMLSSHPKAVEIQDDLESFIHVVLYHAVRYLRSNCEDVGEFIENYFDAYTLQNGVYTCGVNKLLTMKLNGYLQIKDKVRLEFGSPMDAIFSQLLPLFKAYYAVQSYLDELRENANTTPSADGPPPAHPASSSIDVELCDALDDEEFGDIAELDLPHPTNNTPSLHKPTPAEELDASRLDNHDHMIHVMRLVKRSHDWGQDLIGDQVSRLYVPQHPVAHVDVSSNHAAKRVKTITTFNLKPYFSSVPERLIQSAVP